MKKCIHPNVVRLIEVIDDPNARKIYLGKLFSLMGYILKFEKRTGVLTD